MPGSKRTSRTRQSSPPVKGVSGDSKSNGQTEDEKICPYCGGSIKRSISAPYPYSCKVCGLIYAKIPKAEELPFNPPLCEEVDKKKNKSATSEHTAVG